MLYKPVGCEQCNHSGYKGRQAVFEAIIMDPHVEEAVIHDPREHIILEAAKPQGIPTMAEDGISHVLKGTTSMDELQRVVDISGTRHTIRDEESEDDSFASHIV